jgi:hypothetical protein
MKPSPLRSEVGAWSALAIMPMFLASMDEGHARIRKPGESPTIQTLLIASVVQLLAMMKETVDIMLEVAPCLADTVAPFASEFARWTRYRDDAAHIPDRLLRVPAKGRNDARSTDAKFGNGTTVLAYDPNTDSVLTGEDSTQALRLGDAIRRAHALYAACDADITRLTRNGVIPKPVRDPAISNELRLERAKIILAPLNKNERSAGPGHRDN